MPPSLKILFPLILSSLSACGLAGEARFSFKGMFVEGCSCANACAFELTGASPGCSAAGAFSFTSGKYKGASIAGTRVAFVAGSDGWIRIYADGSNRQHREAATRFITDALKGWGKPEKIAVQPISITGKKGTYTTKIGKGGSILELISQPSISTGQSSALSYSNIFNSTLHPVIKQGKTVTCRFNDAGREMRFSGTNGFFHDALSVKGLLKQ